MDVGEFFICECFDTDRIVRNDFYSDPADKMGMEIVLDARRV